MQYFKTRDTFITLFFTGIKFKVQTAYALRNNEKHLSK